MSRELERLLSSQEPSTETMKRKRVDSDVQSAKRLETSAGYQNGSQWQSISPGMKTQNDFQRPQSPVRAPFAIDVSRFVPIILSTFRTSKYYQRRISSLMLFRAHSVNSTANNDFRTFWEKSTSRFSVRRRRTRYQVARQPLQVLIFQNYLRKHGTFWMSISHTHILGYQSLRSMTFCEHHINTLKIAILDQLQDLEKMQHCGRP
jgi:hypothetical protein